MLGKVVFESHRDWNTRNSGVMSAYRATVHDATGYSPNFLMFGRELRAPIDLVLGGPEETMYSKSDSMWKRLALTKGKRALWHATTTDGEPREINIIMTCGTARPNLRFVIESGITIRRNT